MMHELHYTVKAKAMTMDNSMSRETFEDAAMQALMEAEIHLNSLRGNMARLRWHFEISLAPAQPKSAFVTNPSMSNHPFVATPNNGPCSSCGLSRTASIHRPPAKA